MSDTAKNVVSVVAILLLSIFVSVLARSKGNSVCPVVVRHPDVVARFGPSASCSFKSTGSGYTNVRVSGAKGSGVVRYEDGGGVVIF